jgi:hypothetical protein
MPRSGLSGNYGLIPNSVIKDKYEITNIHHDPEDVNEYFRNILKDERPDKPFFESDQIRYDNHSAERLSLRHNGHRTGEVPYHPDMFLELTEREPRGTSTDPNFREAYQQSVERMKYVKLYPDSDHSVTEREKRPSELIRQSRDAFYYVKDKMKFFDTAKDNLIGGSKNFKMTPDSHVTEMTNYDEIKSERLKETVLSNPTDATANISNWTPMGWHRTTDHKFKVAHYGQQREIKITDDISKMLWEIHMDRNKITEFQDQNVSIGLSQLMKDIAQEQKIRYTYMDIDREVAKQILPKKYRSWKDIPENQRKAIVEEIAKAKFKDLENKQQKQPTEQSIQQHWNSDAYINVVKMMATATRSTKQPELQQAIEQQLLEQKVSKDFVDNITTEYLQAKPKNDQSKVDIDNKWKSSMSVKQYSSLGPVSRPDQLKRMVGEGYKTRTETQKNKEQLKPYNKQADNYTEDTQTLEEFGTNDRHRAPFRAKNMREDMVDVREHNPTNDW